MEYLTTAGRVRRTELLLHAAKRVESFAVMFDNDWRAC